MLIDRTIKDALVEVVRISGGQVRFSKKFKISRSTLCSILNKDPNFCVSYRIGEKIMLAVKNLLPAEYRPESSRLVKVVDGYRRVEEDFMTLTDVTLKIRKVLLEVINPELVGVGDSKDWEYDFVDSLLDTLDEITLTLRRDFRRLKQCRCE